MWIAPNAEQRKFIEKQRGFALLDSAGVNRPVSIGNTAGNIVHDKDIISFTQYLTDYNLQDEWEKYLIGEAERRGFIKDASHKGQRGTHLYTINRSLYFSSSRMYGSEYGCIYDSNSGKWAEIIPDELELVKGEIYRIKEDRTFRFKSIVLGKIDYYSQRLNCGEVYINDGDLCFSKDNIKPATDKQKRKLIKQEIKNGYFHELNK